MKDNHNYKGWLNSDSFWKRAFGVWGYYFVANLVIGAVVMAVAIVIFMIIGVSLIDVIQK